MVVQATPKIQAERIQELCNILVDGFILERRYGHWLERIGRLDLAFKHFSGLLARIRAHMQESYLEGKILGDMGNILYEQENFNDALSHFLPALTLRYRYAPNNVSTAAVANNIGMIFYHTKNPADALFYYNLVARIYDIHYPHESKRLLAHQNLANAYKKCNFLLGYQHHTKIANEIMQSNDSLNAQSSPVYVRSIHL